MNDSSNLLWYQQKTVNNVLRELEKPLPLAEAKQILLAKSDNKLPMANSDLQPIDFSIKFASRLKFLRSAINEISTWLINLLGIIFMLVLVSVSFIFFIVLTGSGGFSQSFLKYYPEIFNLFKNLNIVSRRLRYNSASKLYRDKRKPILYLRSFAIDDVPVLTMEDARTVEERLADFYEPVGPVIAVANPFDTRLTYGAIQLEFDDKTWRAAVIYLMSISQLVVIQQGISEGTLWEVGMAKRMLKPHQLLISMASTSEPATAEPIGFRLYAEPIMGTEFAIATGDNLFVAFDEKWKPLIRNHKGEWINAQTASTLSKETTANNISDTTNRSR